MRRSRRSSNTRSMTKMVELAVAAPQVIATRSARILAAGTAPGVADRAEFSKMWTEKGQAFWESLFAMGVQMVKVNQEVHPHGRTAMDACVDDAMVARLDDPEDVLVRRAHACADASADAQQETTDARSLPALRRGSGPDPQARNGKRPQTESNAKALKRACDIT